MPGDARVCFPKGLHGGLPGVAFGRRPNHRAAYIVAGRPRRDGRISWASIATWAWSPSLRCASTARATGPPDRLLASSPTPARARLPVARPGRLRWPPRIPAASQTDAPDREGKGVTRPWRRGEARPPMSRSPRSLRRTRRALATGDRLTARRRRAIARGPRARPHAHDRAAAGGPAGMTAARDGGRWKRAPGRHGGTRIRLKEACRDGPCPTASSDTPCPACPPAVGAGVPARSHRARSPLLCPGCGRWTAGTCAASPCVDAPAAAGASVSGGQVSTPQACMRSARSASRGASAHSTSPINTTRSKDISG